MQDATSSEPSSTPSRTTPPPAKVLTKDELRVISDLAWMVKNSKQKLPLQMRDHADSVTRIVKPQEKQNG